MAQDSNSSPSRRQYTMVYVGLLVSVCAIYLAVREIDFAQLGSVLAAANFYYALPFVGLLATFYLLKLFRWKMLLPAVENTLPTRILAGPMMIGFAANNVLPFRLGELIRLLLAARVAQTDKTTVLGSLVLERLFDVVSILIIGLICLLSFAEVQANLLFGSSALLIALLILSGLFLIVLRASWLLSVAKGLLRYLPSRVASYSLDRFESIERVLAAIGSARVLATILVNSIAQWALICAIILVACLAVGIEIPFAAAVYVMILTTIGISLPSTPGFVGVIEYCFILGLSAFNISSEAALAAAIFYHVLTWSSVVLAGTVYLQKHALSWRRVSDESLSM